MRVGRRECIRAACGSHSPLQAALIAEKSRPASTSRGRVSHSPSKTALIAGRQSKCGTTASSCLIRRHKRRSLRDSRSPCFQSGRYVSFAATSGAHCGHPWVEGQALVFRLIRRYKRRSLRVAKLLISTHEALSNSPSKTALIAERHRGRCGRGWLCLIRRQKRRSLRDPLHP